MNDINFKCSIEGKYKIQILQGGVVVNERPWAKNMILNQGKDGVMAGTRNFNPSFSYCAVGTGTTPVAATDTGLTSEAATARTNTYLTGAGNCGTSWVGQVGTMRRTFDFAVETTNQSYTELGWSYTATKSTNLFSKTLISGGTVTVLADQQLRVVYDVSITCAPVGVQTANLTVAGWGTPAGTWALQSRMFVPIGASGASVYGAGLFETSDSPLAAVLGGTCALGSFGSAPTSTVTLGTTASGTWSTYTLGTFTRSISFPYLSAASFASTDIRMFSYNNNLAFLFDSPQTKLNTYRLRPNGYSITIS